MKMFQYTTVSLIRCLVYCLLVNRAQFQREQLTQPHQQSVCTTRALLCELLANRILRRFHEDHTGAQGLLLLAQILVGGFDPFQGAPPDIMTEENINFSWTIQSRTGAKRKLPALEIAIISESKIFLSSQACQKVVNAIYEGRVIYTPTSFIDIVPDHYKQKPISLYNPRRAPLFNQYRLIVPRTRNILEVLQFMLLLALYICVMIDRDPSKFGTMEMVFIVYTMGWVLDQFASILEHGKPFSPSKPPTHSSSPRLARIHPKPLVLPRRYLLRHLLGLPHPPHPRMANRQTPTSPTSSRCPRHGCSGPRPKISIQSHV